MIDITVIYLGQGFSVPVASNTSVADVIALVRPALCNVPEGPLEASNMMGRKLDPNVTMGDLCFQDRSVIYLYPEAWKCPLCAAEREVQQP